MKYFRKKDYSFERIYKGLIRRLFDIPDIISWYLPSNFSVNNKNKIRQLYNKHKGERCFIIANGPSLKKTDISLLKDEYTIGMNRIYLLKDKIGFLPTYLTVADIEIQLNQFQEEYDNINIPKFFPWKVRRNFTNSDNAYFFRMKYKMSFSPDFTKFIGAGKSVTVVCIQLAYYLGFSEVILIGKDHSYTHEQKSVPGTRIKSTGDEQNHFIKGYYKKGMKWSIPNYLEEEIAYSHARQTFEKDGRKILDATIDGKLNIFEKVDYYEILDKLRVI